MRPRLRLLLLLGAPALFAAAACLVLPTAARAQGATAPAAGSRPGQPAAGSRLIQIVQIDDKGAPVGKPSELPCPPSGCQSLIDVVLGAQTEPFLFSVEFVASGAYVTLSPHSIAVSEVMQWGEGHKGPIFVPLAPRRRQVVSMPFIVVRSGLLRQLEPSHGTDVLAAGRVFNRKRTPDFTLQVSLSTPGG